MTAEAKPDELDCELLTLYGKPALRVAVPHRAHRLVSGEQTYKVVEETYLIGRQPSGFIDLVKSDGSVYTLDWFSCTCPEWQFRRPSGGCKHMRSAARLSLFDAPAAVEVAP